MGKFKIVKPKQNSEFVSPSLAERRKNEKGKIENDFINDTPMIRRLRSSARWQKLRTMILKRHPLCMMCDRGATEIHHIEEAVNNPSLFFRVSNLLPLCSEHHGLITGARKRGISNDVLIPENMKLKDDELWQG